MLGPLFFAPIARENPGLAQILSFATIGISFLFRPLGALVCGDLGDRFGRKFVLVATLILMGASTMLIGILPTYGQIGAWAPIALIVLRVVQGFSAGGEWGGAALMAVEHAPNNRRSFFGAFPQIGVPIGLIIATLVLLALTSVLGKDAFAQWGWRLPFLFSVVLIVAGSIIRRSVEESPVFEKMHQRRRESSAPLRLLFRRYTKEIVLTALIFVGNNAAGYLLIAFFIAYGQKVLHLPQLPLLAVCTLAAVGWLGFTLIGGLMGDRYGRVRTFQIGYVALALWAIPMWFLIDSGSLMLFFIAALVLTIPLGNNLRTAGCALRRNVPGPRPLLGRLRRLCSRLDPRRRVRSDNRAVDHFGLRPVLAHRGLYRLLSVISIVAVSLVRDPMGVDLNDQKVHEDFLQEHPELAGRVPGVAGNP